MDPSKALYAPHRRPDPAEDSKVAAMAKPEYRARLSLREWALALAIAKGGHTKELTSACVHHSYLTRMCDE